MRPSSASPDTTLDPTPPLRAVGGSVLDPEVVQWKFGRERAASRLAELTPREREVLALLAEGCSNQAAAEHIVVSRRAVEQHVTAILAELGLSEEPAARRHVLAVLAFLEDARAATGRG